MKKYLIFNLVLWLMFSCNMPKPPEKKVVRPKHNYIVLLDLSDRLIVQENQPARDREIIDHIYQIFSEKVKNDLYIKSRDEFKVVIAPQRGDGLPTHVFEDRLYYNIENMNLVERRKKEEERYTHFVANLDTLYKEAVFSKNPKAYYGADIWKYFYEDLQTDYSSDTLTSNYLFILTDGYPIVGKDRSKLQPIKNKYPDLQVVLIEAAPRDKDMEWDRIMDLWTQWFEEIGVENYTMIKRKAISKEKEQLSDIVFNERPETI